MSLSLIVVFLIIIVVVLLVSGYLMLKRRRLQVEASTTLIVKIESDRLSQLTELTALYKDALGEDSSIVRELEVLLDKTAKARSTSPGRVVPEFRILYSTIKDLVVSDDHLELKTKALEWVNLIDQSDEMLQGYRNMYNYAADSYNSWLCVFPIRILGYFLGLSPYTLIDIPTPSEEPPVDVIKLLD